MNTQNSRSTELLNRVYDELDKVDLSKLSMREMSDFLEVVQKGRFLETTGQLPALGFGGFGSAFNSPAKHADATTNAGEINVTADAK